MNPDAKLAKPGVVYSVVLDTSTGRGQGSIGVNGPEGFEAFMRDTVQPIAKQLGFAVSWKKTAAVEPGATPAQRF